MDRSNDHRSGKTHGRYEREMGGKRYVSQRFCWVSGKDMQVSDASHRAMRGGCDETKTALLAS